nr:putative E3 ubiquitin-protein ligase RF298 isoform X1 [Ipomoea batatas]
MAEIMKSKATETCSSSAAPGSDDNIIYDAQPLRSIAPQNERDVVIMNLNLHKQRLQRELAALEGNSASLQAQIKKARRRQSEFEALQQHEEREKIKLLQKAEALRRERAQMKELAKAEEDHLSL